MNTTMSMERPPRSADEPLFRITTFRPDGSEQVSTVTRRGFRRFLMLLAGFGILYLLFSEAFPQWANHMERDARRPAMEKLANEGQDHAALWLVKNYWQEEQSRLPALVAKGNVEATFYQGSLKHWQGDKEGGLQLIEQAAARGYLPAIKFLESEKKG